VVFVSSGTLERKLLVEVVYVEEFEVIGYKRKVDGSIPSTISKLIRTGLASSTPFRAMKLNP